jgi:hypothetical protein
VPPVGARLHRVLKHCGRAGGPCDRCARTVNACQDCGHGSRQVAEQHATPDRLGEHLTAESNCVGFFRPAMTSLRDSHRAAGVRPKRQKWAGEVPSEVPYPAAAPHRRHSAATLVGRRCRRTLVCPSITRRTRMPGGSRTLRPRRASRRLPTASRRAGAAEGGLPVRRADRLPVKVPVSGRAGGRGGDPLGGGAAARNGGPRGRVQQRPSSRPP